MHADGHIYSAPYQLIGRQVEVRETKDKVRIYEGPRLVAEHERSWERYHGNVAALVKEGVTDENRSNLVSTIRKHAQVIESLRQKVA